MNVFYSYIFSFNMVQTYSMIISSTNSHESMPGARFTVRNFTPVFRYDFDISCRLITDVHFDHGTGILNI